MTLEEATVALQKCYDYYPIGTVYQDGLNHIRGTSTVTDQIFSIYEHQNDYIIHGQSGKGILVDSKGNYSLILLEEEYIDPAFENKLESIRKIIYED